ncbi:MAG: ornithine cyclodeaminase [Gammaproteobacteria bacterium]|nr:MAG: ornithine cyclodeaminase [Gammaproteobacteria bacterium]
MLMLDADKLLHCLPFTTLVDELASMHRDPIGLVDEMLMESVDDNDSVSHFFIRTGWQPEKAVGAKVITVFPRNNQTREYPSIQAVYILFEAVHGSPVACLDGTALTWLKTASDSALASKLLSREDIESMLMIGAGQMAPHLLAAHCEVRPSLKRVQVWNRTAEKAQQLCKEMKQKFPGIDFSAVSEIEAPAREADLICSAIGRKDPIIEGVWLKPGAHVDLIGAFTPDMREADDEVMRRGSLFVDARETTINHIGELMIPLASGVISEADVLADLSDLCQQRHAGRSSEDEITVFKNGGGGHLDLMCARILHDHCSN